MIELKFVHVSEPWFVFYRIDRANKKLWGSNQKTDNKIVPLPWKGLFDKRKEKAQDKLTENLTDQEFKMIIILAMMKNGYKERV